MANVDSQPHTTLEYITSYRKITVIFSVGGAAGLPGDKTTEPRKSSLENHLSSQIKFIPYEVIIQYAYGDKNLKNVYLSHFGKGKMMIKSNILWFYHQSGLKVRMPLMIRTNISEFLSSTRLKKAGEFGDKKQIFQSFIINKPQIIRKT